MPDMNVLRILIVVALVAHYVVELTASLLNLRSLGPEPPPEFRGAVDEVTYRRTGEYTRARTTLGIAHDTAGLIALFGFWWLGGFEWLDRVSRGIGVGPIVTGLIYLGALALASWVLRLPFRLFGTFVLEARFGFNRMSGRTFWADIAKGLVLSTVLGALLLAGVLTLFQRAGDGAWIWCWVMTAGVTVAMQFVAPVWILPMFNRFQPLEDGELREAILGYARSVAFPLESISVMDGSRRTTKGNAFLTGFGRHKRIALFDTLVGRQSVDELIAIVAHEIGHYKQRHLQRGLGIALLHMGVVFWLVSVVLDYQALYGAFFVTTSSTYVGLVLFGVLFGPLELPLGILANVVSRRYEYQADAFAARTTKGPDALVSALKKLSADHLAHLTPHPFSVWLHDSHPPLRDRIAALAHSGDQSDKEGVPV